MLVNIKISRNLFIDYAADVDCFFPCVITGSVLPLAEASFTVTFTMFSESGKSNIVYELI